MSRYIFKTNVQNEYRIRNKADVYKRINKKKQTNKPQGNESTMPKRATMRMRILPTDIPLKSGEIWQKVLLEIVQNGFERVFR